MNPTQIKRFAAGSALLLTACTGGSHSVPSSRSAATSTTAKHLAAPLSARVVVPSKTIVAGATVDAKVIVENNTGNALNVAGCGSLFAVALGNDNIQPAVAWPACVQTFTVPVGESSYAVPVIASYLSCGTGGPNLPCTDGRPPPLPPGKYQAKLYQNSTAIPAPAPITVRVTP